MISRTIQSAQVASSFGFFSRQPRGPDTPHSGRQMFLPASVRLFAPVSPAGRDEVFASEIHALI